MEFMKRKLIFLSSTEYSETVVDSINGYFILGWEIEKILNADCGYYIILVFKCNDSYDCKFAAKSDSQDKKCELIEETNNPEQRWVVTNTKDINPS